MSGVILHGRLCITSRDSLSLEIVWPLSYHTGINLVNPSTLGTMLKHGKPAYIALPHIPVTGSTRQSHPSTAQGEFIVALGNS